MESVVTDGSGKHAAVQGYSIGGKTGTSEPIYTQKDNGYVASYAAIAPVEDTQVTLLLTLYDPPANNHQGGTLAGPVVGQMLTEILPYLGIPTTDTDSSSSSDSITVPNVKEKTVAEAKKTLESSGFKVKTYVKGDANNILVADQNPKPGSNLSKNSVIILYHIPYNIPSLFYNHSFLGNPHSTTVDLDNQKKEILPYPRCGFGACLRCRQAS